MEATSLDTEEDVKLDVEPATMICRGCLKKECRMKNIILYENYYTELTGLQVSQSDGLPQWLCSECIALLLKSVRLKQRMLQAHNTLYQYLVRCAPFGIDPHDEELSKYSTPHLTNTEVLVCQFSAKGKIGPFQVWQHEKQTDTLLQQVTAEPIIDKIETNVKDEPGFSDYEDNITLDEIKSINTKINMDEIESFLQENNSVKLEPDVKRKKKLKKKEEKVKNQKRKSENVELEITRKSSIRKPVELDPSKIRIITLNPEEQIRQSQDDAKVNFKFPFQCKLCSKGFNFESKLDNHMSKHSPNRGSFECKLCHMYLPTAYSFNVHNLIHTRRYECVECGRRMIDKSSIIDHYRTQHEGLMTIYTCQFCGKVSNNSKTHRGHLRNHHSGDRPKCDQCGKSFVNKDSLAEHIQIHQGIKNYECSICNKKFRTRTQIKHHQLKHSDVKDFYCVECDVRFKSAHSLKQHLQKNLKHKDKDMFVHACAACPQRYASARALQHHVSVQHEGVRTHVCATCGAGLATRASLHKHTRHVHDGRRARPQHVCHTCGKAFTGKSVLTNHVRTHTGEKPFECPSCGRKFSQKTAMQTHVKLVHLKVRRQTKVKPEIPTDSEPPKLDIFKPEPSLEPWRQPCDVYFQVTAGN